MDDLCVERIFVNKHRSFLGMHFQEYRNSLLIILLTMARQHHPQDISMTKLLIHYYIIDSTTNCFLSSQKKIIDHVNIC
jgi:hypothetical protein